MPERVGASGPRQPIILQDCQHILGHLTLTDKFLPFLAYNKSHTTCVSNPIRTWFEAVHTVVGSWRPNRATYVATNSLTRRLIVSESGLSMTQATVSVLMNQVGLVTHQRAPTEGNQGTFTARASSGREASIPGVHSSPVDVAVALKVHHRLRLGCPRKEDGAAPLNDIMQGARRALGTITASDEGVVVHLSRNAELLLDGDWKPVKRTSRLRQRVQIASPGDGRVPEELGDAIGLLLTVVSIL